MVGAQVARVRACSIQKKIKRFKKIICSADAGTPFELKPLTYKKDKLGSIIEDEFKIAIPTLFRPSGTPSMITRSPGVKRNRKSGRSR